MGRLGRPPNPLAGAVYSIRSPGMLLFKLFRTNELHRYVFDRSPRDQLAQTHLTGLPLAPSQDRPLQRDDLLQLPCFH